MHSRRAAKSRGRRYRSAARRSNRSKRSKRSNRSKRSKRSNRSKRSKRSNRSKRWARQDRLFRAGPSNSKKPQDSHHRKRREKYEAKEQLLIEVDFFDTEKAVYAVQKKENKLLLVNAPGFEFPPEDIRFVSKKHAETSVPVNAQGFDFLPVGKRFQLVREANTIAPEVMDMIHVLRK